MQDNIWLGVSCEDQKTADQRIPLLLQTPAAVRFVSCEPLLGEIDLSYWLNGCPEQVSERAYVTREMAMDAGNPELEGSLLSEHEWQQTCYALDWVICGGESGPHARPMHPDWARSIRDQCREAGVPYFFKQWGEWLPAGQGYKNYEGKQPLNVFGDGTAVAKVGKKNAGRLLDGQEWSEYPK